MEQRPFRNDINFAVIQYETAKGEMRVLMFSDYDIRNLKHRVSLHMCNSKKVLSIQFFYAVEIHTSQVKITKKGTILE